MWPWGSLVSQLLIAFIVRGVLFAAAAAGCVGAGGQGAASREPISQAHVLRDAVSALREDFTTSQLAASGFALTGEGGFLGSFRHTRMDFAVQPARLGLHGLAAGAGLRRGRPAVGPYQGVPRSHPPGTGARDRR